MNGRRFVTGIAGRNYKIRLTDPLQTTAISFSKRDALNSKKIIIGLVGLVVGFVASFLWTRDYNAKGAGASAAASQSTRTSGGDIGNQQQMMTAVRRIIEKAKNNPKDFQAQLEAASAFDQIGRGTETVEYLKKAYEISPAEAARQQVPAYLGDWYMKQRSYGEAEAWFRRSLEHEPNNPELMRELGTTFIEREPADVERGIQYIQSALKLSPKDAHALLHLVQAYLIKKDAALAEDALRRLKQADPNGQNIKIFETQVENLKAGRPVTVPKE